jgi:hypothetical protein
MLEKFKHFRIHCSYCHYPQNGECNVCQNVGTVLTYDMATFQNICGDNLIKYSQAHSHSRRFKSTTVSETNSISIIRVLILEP